MIFIALDSGPHRFGAMKKAVPGISPRMLTLTLRNLERDGIATRTVFAEVPPRVEYELTALGVSLRPAVMGLANWAIEHDAEIRRNRAAYDDARDPGAEI